MELKIDNEFKSLIPPQRPDEHQLLEESILKNGYDKAYPVIIWDGFLVDGHNRYDICKKHGIDFTISEKDFSSRHEALNWIIDNQLSRRNLDELQKEYLIGKRYKEEKRSANRPTFKDVSQKVGNNYQLTGDKSPSELIAKQNNVSERTVRNAEKFADAVDEIAVNTGINPQRILSGQINTTRKDIHTVSKLKPKTQKKVFEKIEKNEVKNVKEAVKKVEQEEIEEIKDSIVLPDPIRIIHGDFRDVYPTLEKESVDFIITDPPYPKEYLNLYEDLAKCAEHVLKQGGSLLMMVGQSYLPEIIEMTTPYLKYNWMLCYFTPGPATQLWQRKVNTSWKPILWFTKGDFHGKWVQDVIKSEHRDKDFHEWGQSESGMYDLMNRFVKSGEVVLDPFLGGGTTGAICKELKCEFIGIEKESDAFSRSKVRLGGI